MTEEELQEEYSLSEEDKRIVDALSEADVAKIDEWLLSSTIVKWRKVAMVVAEAIRISDEKGELLEVPDAFFGMRIEKFVEDGALLSQGNLKRMRFSEVRRPT